MCVCVYLCRRISRALRVDVDVRMCVCVCVARNRSNKPSVNKHMLRYTICHTRVEWLTDGYAPAQQRPTFSLSLYELYSSVMHAMPITGRNEITLYVYIAREYVA